jgi:murein DD-endopeptidase MepM/ murein hydrolase activator NlpD
MSKWILPFEDKAITGHFGKIRTIRGAPTSPHRGTDYAPGAEEIIPNITAGVIARIQWSNIMGWGVIIKTDSLDTDGKPWYWGVHHLHCAEHGINCAGPKKLGKHSPFYSSKVGDRKELSEPVGRIGNSGSATSGAHGHFTLSKTEAGAWSGKVYDLYKHIKAEQKKPAPKPKVTPKPKVKAKPKPVVVIPAKVVETKTVEKIIYACPHCKKELK